MEAYSLDLRRRVVAAVEAGELGRAEIADLFQVSTAWVRRLLQRYRQSGSLAPQPRRYGPPPKLDDARLHQLATLVQQEPDATLAELQQRLQADVSLPTLCRALARLGLPRKKSRSAPASRTGPTCKSAARPSQRKSKPWRRRASSPWTRPEPPPA